MESTLQKFYSYLFPIHLKASQSTQTSQKQTEVVKQSPGTARAEFERLHKKVIYTTEQSLDSTRRMICLCEESREAGLLTLVALDEQGGQLDIIEEALDVINNDMMDTETHLTKMERVCGLFSNPCGKCKKFNSNSSTWMSNDDGMVVSGQPTRLVNFPNGAGIGITEYIVKITNDAREVEMEENMARVADMVGTLRNMAVDIGEEVLTQNQQMERINLKTELNKNRIEDANRRALKLII